MVPYWNWQVVLCPSRFTDPFSVDAELVTPVVTYGAWPWLPPGGVHLLVVRVNVPLESCP